MSKIIRVIQFVSRQPFVSLIATKQSKKIASLPTVARNDTRREFPRAELLPKKGFTFAEIMVSVAIFTILAVAILLVLIVGQKAWHADVGRVELQQEARLAMDGMTREVRESKRTDISISGGSRIDISNYPGASGTIAYYLQNGRLIREYPAGTEKILAGDTETVDFSLSGDILTIQLDLGKTVYGADLNFSLKEQVRLRNQ